jgi:acyl-CoA synthetase (AMP-forming)/AMP-acid ligase II
VIDDLPIDRLARNAEDAPQAPLLPRFTLTNAEAWAQSGAVASWLIAQGFGPGAPSIAVLAPDGPERTVLLLGALRAGALVVETAAEAALAFAINAAVAERRLHIRANTPARIIGGVCRRHGDSVTIAEAVSA